MVRTKCEADVKQTYSKLSGKFAMVHKEALKHVLRPVGLLNLSFLRSQCEADVKQTYSKLSGKFAMVHKEALKHVLRPVGLLNLSFKKKPYYHS